MASSPRLLMRYVRNTLSPSRMNALWPWYSSTPKSLSKLSVSVYHGIVQPIRAFRRSMSFCGARDAYTSVVSRVHMGQVGDLVRADGAAVAGVLGPAEYSRLEEGAIDDQLPAALEQIEQANLALGPQELVLLFYRHPRHPSTLGSQGVAGPHLSLFLHEHLLPRSLPLLWRHNRRCVHSKKALPLGLVCWHVIFSFESLYVRLPVTPLTKQARRPARSETIRPPRWKR